MATVTDRKLGYGLFFICLLLFPWVYLESAANDKDRLIIMSVGQGDSILFESEQGERVLFDSGPDNSAAKKLSKILPWWDRRIEAIVISHAHADHLGGLGGILEAFSVGRIFVASDIDQTAELAALSDMAKQKGTVIISLDKEHILRLRDGDAVDLLVNQEGDANERSIIAMLEADGARAALLADLGADGERRAVEAKPDFKPSLLKISHHGSDFGTSPELLSRWQPKAAAISVGKNNSFGHPSLRVLKRLERAGVSVSRTDIDGDLVYESENGFWELEKQ